MWEKGILMCKELQIQYEKELFDYIQLGELLVSFSLTMQGLDCSDFLCQAWLRKSDNIFSTHKEILLIADNCIMLYCIRLKIWPKFHAAAYRGLLRLAQTICLLK